MKLKGTALDGEEAKSYTFREFMSEYFPNERHNLGAHTHGLHFGGQQTHASTLEIFPRIVLLSDAESSTDIQQQNG